MSSLWKDLLFLHGHLLRREDMDWHPDAAPERDVAPAKPSSPPAPRRSSPSRDEAACCA